MIAPDERLVAGARNCVLDCAGVTPGQRVGIVNEIGSVDEIVAAAIERVVRDAGAELEVVWAPAFDRRAADARIPAEVVRLLGWADVAITHYDSVSRSALQAYFPAERRVRVPNRAVTAELLASAWARFPYGVQRVISGALEERMQPGMRWHISSPSGTDLRGRFVAAESDVAAAFFQTDEDNNRARRNFPGGVHPPKLSLETAGTLVADYVDRAPFEAGQPVRLEIAAGRISAIEGGAPGGAARARVEASDGYFDSWHAGVNPQTIVPVARGDQPRKWYEYAHCSPQMVHFHLGRGHDTINVGVLAHTLEIEGVVVYDNGCLQLADETAVAAALERFGLRPAALFTEAIAS